MSQITHEVECLQYADDTTSQRNACVNRIEKDILSILTWSSETNLNINITKTKVMLISTPQMSKYHQLKEEKVNVKCNNITLERVSEWKLLGVTLDEHFQLDKHYSKLCKDCYFSLSMLKKLKRYTLLPLQKKLTDGTETHNHLVCKRRLNHLAKLVSMAKWLSVCLQTTRFFYEKSFYKKMSLKYP